LSKLQTPYAWAIAKANKQPAVTRAHSNPYQYDWPDKPLQTNTSLLPTSHPPLPLAPTEPSAPQPAVKDPPLPHRPTSPSPTHLQPSDAAMDMSWTSAAPKRKAATLDDTLSFPCSEPKRPALPSTTFAASLAHRVFHVALL
jgi:hypothetical protein